MPGFLDFLKIIEPYVEPATKVATQIGQARGQNRAVGNIERGERDQTAVQRYTAEQAAKLRAAELQETATKDRAERYLTSGRERAGQAAFGDALSNIRDVEVSGLPGYIPKINFGGGLRPSIFGGTAREAGRTLSRDALQAMLSGADVPNLPNMAGLGGNAPELSELEQPSAVDKILDTIGYAGAGIGAINEARRGKQAQTEGRGPTTDERVRAALPHIPTTAQLPTGKGAGQTARIPTAFEQQLASLQPNETRAQALAPSQYLDAIQALKDAQAQGYL